jgi:uncharacterized oligopeptide transporter (OPT) family protein
VIKVRLRFPSGHATATVISVLHDKAHSDASAEVSWRLKISSLMYSFAFSSAYVNTSDMLSNGRQLYPTSFQCYHRYPYFRLT